MQTYPLTPLTVEQAKELQFKLVDIIQQVFTGKELLMAGDYGVVPGLNQPLYTSKVEEVLARFFQAEAAVLVRGAGTGAIRSFFNANIQPGANLLVHDAPLYPTTRVTVESMGLKVRSVDFNQLNNAKFPEGDFAAVLIQHTRQTKNDSYDLAEVINKIKAEYPQAIIITDDNYAVMKVEKIGSQLGADVSAFSLFKLLGPEGIGCLVGKEKLIRRVKDINYSGGSQVQGPEAMEVLKSLVYAPVMLAVQAEVTTELVTRLNRGEVAGVKGAYLANAQSRVVLVEFAEPVAKSFLQEVADEGGVPYPVGAESRHEIGAMFYRISGTFRKADPEAENYLIRVNPMRAGADTIIRILRNTLKKID